MSHGRTVCTHGALIAQCRCIDHKNTTVVACPWPDVHADYPTLPTPAAPGTDHSEVEAVARVIAAEDSFLWSGEGNLLVVAEPMRAKYRRLARAALAARRPVTEAEAAVRRVEALAEEFAQPVTGITLDGLPMTALFGGGDVAYRIRAALGAAADGGGR